jgi:ornithine carbamoyltransferase
MRHFLKLSDAAPDELGAWLSRAIELKAGARPRDLARRTLAMIFTKHSTRTRLSFEVAMTRLGGAAVWLPSSQTQMGRDEPLADTARVMSRMCDGIMIRNHSQTGQEELAAHSRVPVINGLSDLHHPCQLLADLMTWQEHAGSLQGRSAAWLGDGNNVCNSWIEAARLFDFELRVATPAAYRPDAAALAFGGDRVQLLGSASDALRGAELVTTDTWTSMGQENEHQQRLNDFGAYQVNAPAMRLAHPKALFMHCLPAHRGEEVTAEVIDGPQSVVWDEAENRLWAQMALLEALLQ